MPRPFMTTRWTDLCVFSYAMPPDLLEPHLPPGLELDTRDGQAFASLVAFRFRDTRVLGVPWPGYRDFPELNLRFYVRQGADRGVRFIREIIPLRFPAWVARLAYNESFVVAPVSEKVCDEGEVVQVQYRLKWAGQLHELAIVAGKPAHVPPPTSMARFFLEQRFGYGRDRRGRCTRFEVEHPPWKVHPIQSWRLDFDWGEVYGPEWKLLDGRKPCSVVLADGSEVRVFRRGSNRGVRGVAEQAQHTPSV